MKIFRVIVKRAIEQTWWVEAETQEAAETDWEKGRCGTEEMSPLDENYCAVLRSSPAPDEVQEFHDAQKSE